MKLLICFSHRKSLIGLPVVEFLLATLQVSEAVWIFENVRFLFDGHTLPGQAFWEVFAGLGGVAIFEQLFVSFNMTAWCLNVQRLSD